MTQPGGPIVDGSQAAELQRIEERLATAGSRAEKKRLNQVRHWLNTRNLYLANLRHAEQRLCALGYPDKEK